MPLAFCHAGRLKRWTPDSHRGCGEAPDGVLLVVVVEFEHIPAAMAVAYWFGIAACCGGSPRRSGCRWMP